MAEVLTKWDALNTFSRVKSDPGLITSPSAGIPGAKEVQLEALKSSK